MDEWNYDGDSDSDGLWDGDEYFGDQPNKLYQWNYNEDEDKWEWAQTGENYDGVDNTRWHYITDPKKIDTDSDTKTDLEEINEHTVPFMKIDNTLDLDGDGLCDSDERTADGHPLDPSIVRNLDGIWQNGYITDPNNPDTDGDGINDGKELIFGTNPLIMEGFFTYQTFGYKILDSNDNEIDYWEYVSTRDKWRPVGSDFYEDNGRYYGLDWSFQDLGCGNVIENELPLEVIHQQFLDTYGDPRDGDLLKEGKSIYAPTAFDNWCDEYPERESFWWDESVNTEEGMLSTVNEDRVQTIEDGLKKYPIFYMCGHTETTLHSNTNTWENWEGLNGPAATTKSTAISAESLWNCEINSRLIFWDGCTAGVDGSSPYDWVDLFIKHSTVPRVYIAPIGTETQSQFLMYVSDISRSLKEGKTFSEAHASARYHDENTMLFAKGIGPNHRLNDLFTMEV